jgi:segregation and condensation protein A
MTGGFQLSLPGFDGPVDELPSVVTARQLALDDIPLASIPTQFLAAARDGAIDLDLAGDVLAATARLMLMKSAHLLAQPQEQDDEPELAAAREKDPRLLEPAAALAARQGTMLYPSVGRSESVPRIAGTRPVSGLVDAWRGMRSRETEGRARASVPAFVRLEVAVSRIISRLGRGVRVSLNNMLGRATREEVVMHFLAALELARRGDIQVEQDTLFGDIHMGWTDGRRERADRAG